MMTAGLRSWWKKARKTLEVLGIIVVCLSVLSLLVVIVLAYLFKVDVAGLHGKMLWDWLQLLIIPFALTIVAIWFNRVERRNEQAIASDNQRENALQSYLDRMSELLLEKNLRVSKPNDEVRNVARARTLTILPQLDAKRKGSVMRFLSESHLLDIVD